MFIICIIASLIEYLAFRMSYQNIIFSALIGQVIAFRYIHFGYLPGQSYLLFGAIIITIIAFILTERDMDINASSFHFEVVSF